MPWKGSIGAGWIRRETEGRDESHGGLRFGHELGQEGSPSRPDDGPPRLRRPEPLPSRPARPGPEDSPAPGKGRPGEPGWLAPAGRQTRRVPSTPKQEVPPILPHEGPSRRRGDGRRPTGSRHRLRPGLPVRAAPVHVTKDGSHRYRNTYGP